MDFREKSFKAISDYMRRAADEISGVDEIRARFHDLGPTSFGCTVVNRRKANGAVHLTVHMGGASTSLGDIYFSHSENAQADTANGPFSVQADDYELFLKGGTYAHQDQRVSAQQVALLLWEDLLARAGIAYS